MLFAAPSALAVLLAVVIPLVLLLALFVWAGGHVFRLPAWIDDILDGPSAPVIAGILSALIALFVWGSLDAPAFIHDEDSYLLQARIFASGHWTGVTPPLPEFSLQPHVLVEPHLASKYPPGNAALLVPGIWLARPGLMPIVFSGLSGGLLFALARRAGSPAIALVAWALWATSRAGLLWRASYFSENASGVLLLVAWFALWRWTRERTLPALVVVSICLAAMFLTRPATAVGFGVPIAVFVLSTAISRRSWRALAIAVGAGLPILLITLVWQKEVLGDWFTNPFTEYSRQYTPYDTPGFEFNAAPLSPALPPGLAAAWQPMVALHAMHTVGALPAILCQRVGLLALTLGAEWRAFLVVLAVLGVATTRGPTRFAALSAASLMGVYLIQAHPAQWVLYYEETFPVFFLAAAMGLAWLGRKIDRFEPAHLRAVLVVVVVLMTPGLVRDVLAARRTTDAYQRFSRSVATALAAVPGEDAVVFLRYDPGHNYDFLVPLNTPDYRTTRHWLVWDRGADDARLLATTTRPAYRLDVDTGALEKLR
jgi:hypothetical protein